MALDEQDLQKIRELMNSTIEPLKTLVISLHDSHSREIAEVKETIARMSVKLDKVAAGAHYVTRLVEWSESQDQFQADILRRVQVLEQKVSKLPPPPG